MGGRSEWDRLYCVMVYYIAVTHLYRRYKIRTSARRDRVVLLNLFRAITAECPKIVTPGHLDSLNLWTDLWQPPLRTGERAPTTTVLLLPLRRRRDNINKYIYMISLRNRCTRRRMPIKVISAK